MFDSHLGIVVCPINTIVLIHMAMELKESLVRPYDSVQELEIILNHFTEYFRKFHSHVFITIMESMDQVWMAGLIIQFM
jgi:biotin-(acetyl-CoA carboxylase) ligase